MLHIGNPIARYLALVVIWIAMFGIYGAITGSVHWGVVIPTGIGVPAVMVFGRQIFRRDGTNN